MHQGRVVITRKLPAIAIEKIRAATMDVEVLQSDQPPNREQLLDRVVGVGAILSTLLERIDAELLDAAGTQLRVVANFAVGIDNIDVAACTGRGVRVTNTPGVLTNATADLTWALILAAARRVVEDDGLLRGGRWSGWEPLQLCGLELRDATLGIVGAGRIGTAVARRAVGFGMRVIYHSRSANEELEREIGAVRVELSRLLESADVVSLHVPLTQETRGLIGGAQLGAMKTSAVLVNTARGPVVDEAALVEALGSGQIAAAGLDVYTDEPRLAAGLADLPNVVLLPHLGSATVQTRSRMAEMAADNLLAVLDGREPANPVN